MFNTQNFNRYGYVWNNPLRYTDPSGEWIWIIGAIIGAYIRGANVNNGNLNPLTWDWNWKTIGGILEGAVIGAIAGGGLDIAILGKSFLGITNVTFGIGGAIGSVGIGINTYGKTDFFWKTRSGGSGSVNITPGKEPSIEGAKPPLEEASPSPSANEPGGLGHLQEQQNGGSYSIDEAVSWLNNNSHSSFLKAKAKGDGAACGRFCRYALEAGFGLEKDALRGKTPVPARDYGSFLEGNGFNLVSTNNYIKGDIAVIQGYPGGTSDDNGIPYGHVQMYNGNIWISNFKQRRDGDFWPGRLYRKNKPSFKIYRR